MYPRSRGESRHIESHIARATAIQDKIAIGRAAKRQVTGEISPIDFVAWQMPRMELSIEEPKKSIGSTCELVPLFGNVRVDLYIFFLLGMASTVTVYRAVGELEN